MNDGGGDGGNDNPLLAIEAAEEDTDNNNETHPLEATIRHVEMLITMTTNLSLLRTTETQ